MLSTTFLSSADSLVIPSPLELLVVDRRAKLQWNTQLIPQSSSVGRDEDAYKI